MTDQGIRLGILIMLYGLYGRYYAGKTWGWLEYSVGKKLREEIEEILGE